MYDAHMKLAPKFKSCSNYKIASIETEDFKNDCNVQFPNLEDLSANNHKIDEELRSNATPLLCYSIYHNVYAICHPETEATIDMKEPSFEAEKFCDQIPELKLPEKCTSWIPDDETKTSVPDCFLVNKVVSVVLKNPAFCKNKCLPPKLNEEDSPSIIPFCEKLLDSTLTLLKILEAQNKSSTTKINDVKNNDTQPPPGLALPKKDNLESSKVKDEKISEEVEKEDASGSGVINTPEKKADTDPKPIEEKESKKTSKGTPVDNGSPIMEGKAQLDKNVSADASQISNDLSSNATKDINVSEPSIVEKGIGNITEVNDTLTTTAFGSEPEDAKVDTANDGTKIKSSMAATDSQFQSSGSFTSVGNELTSDGTDLTQPPPNAPILEENTDGKGKDNAEDKTSKDGAVSDKLVGEESNVDNNESQTVNEAVESDNEKVDLKKEVVETKYENNMKSGPQIDEQSSFFGYFILLSIVAIIAYLVFHNKQKILALILEGRRRQGNRRRSGGREYRKLDSNLEVCNIQFGTSLQVIYQDTMDPAKETSLRQVIY